MVVDFTETTFIDSTTLGVLVGGVKRLRPNGGRLSLVCSDRNIAKIFEITGLNKVFDIYESRDEAVRSTDRGPGLNTRSWTGAASSAWPSSGRLSCSPAAGAGRLTDRPPTSMRAGALRPDLRQLPPLRDAATLGTVGPNLDDAFHGAREKSGGEFDEARSSRSRSTRCDCAAPMPDYDNGPDKLPSSSSSTSRHASPRSRARSHRPRWNRDGYGHDRQGPPPARRPGR